MIEANSGYFEKFTFGNFFECADEFYRCYNSAMDDRTLHFKIPLKTEIFRGFLLCVFLANIVYYAHIAFWRAGDARVSSV